MRASTWCVFAFILLTALLSGCSRNLLHRARIQEGKGNTESALRLYQELLSRTPPSDPQQRSELQTHIGECLYRLNRIADAFASFQGAVETDNNNLLARLRIGEMFLSAGIPDRAREQAMIILDSKSQDSEALSLLGAAWAATDNSDLAKAAYERVLAADPKRMNVAVALADIYNREENVSKAREILQSATIARPGSATPLLARARLEEQEGNGKGAEEAYRRAVAAEDTPETSFRLAQFLERSGRITEAEQQLRHVDALRRSNPVALGDFQLASGHPLEALDSYRAGPDASPRPSSQRGLWHRFSFTDRSENRSDHGSIQCRLLEAEIGQAALRKGDDRALALRAVRSNLQDLRQSLDPATAAIIEAELALSENDVPLAQVLANSAVQRAPQSPSALYVKGLVDDAAGDSDGALQQWRSAVEIQSNFVPARIAVAEKALEQNNLEEADQQARAVVRDEPGNLRGLLLFSRVLLARSDAASAAMIAQRASALAPSSAEPVVLFARAALQQNHLPQALLAFERAVALDPESEDAVNGLLSVYRQSGISYRVVEKMELAAQYPPVSVTLLELAGRLYADHGWNTEAIRSLTKAVQIDPKRITAARELARIQLATGDLSQAAMAAKHMDGNSAAILNAYQAQEAGNWQQAIEGYEQALRSGEQNGAAANNLAWLYAEHSTRLDRALALAEIAAAAEPNNPAILDTLGFVFYQRRDYTSAVKTLETAVSLVKMRSAGQSRDSIQIRKHLAAAYLSAGNTQAASLIAQLHRSSAFK